MLLFKKPFHAGLQSGAITLTFRRWKKPHVKPGGRYRCHPIGVLEVDAVALIRVADITADDASGAGFDTRDALVAYLAELGPVSDDTEVWRVELHHGGDGDRVGLALDDKLGDADVAAIRAKLARLDRDGTWTAKTLALIDANPRVAASQLAKKLKRETLPFKVDVRKLKKLGRETEPFKIDVRKLKKLGLTQSFEVGYEISPRGRAYLAATSTKQPARGYRSAASSRRTPRSPSRRAR